VSSMLRQRDRRSSVRTLMVALGFVVSAAFMYVAVRGAHPQKTLDALRDTDYRWLVPSLALLVLAFFIRGVRWHSLFSPSARPPLGPVVSAQFVGYVANALLPMRAGEAAAIVALNKSARTPIAEGTATMFVQRAEDVLSLAFLLFVTVPWLPHVSWLRAAGLLAVVLLLVLAALAALVLISGERVIRILARPLRRLPFVPSEALERAPTQFVRGLVGLVNVRVAVISFAWTTLSWIVLGLGFWLVMKASGLSLSPLAGVLVVIGIGLAMILPSAPAALGVFEGATVVVLGAYDVPDSQALSYAFVLHAMNVVPLFVVAAGVLVLRRLHPPARTQLASPALGRDEDVSAATGS
jgi:uncharacterized protein (TIRG00374 family)